jgi:ABC-type uncharacterized transport system
MADSTSPTVARFGIGLNVVLQILLSTGICFGINYLSYRYYQRWDLSATTSHTLSSSTTNYLRKLAKDVEITVVFTRGSTLYEEVQSLVDAYRQNGKGRVKVTFVDPALDLERTEQLKVENRIAITENGILIKANKGQRFLKEGELTFETPGPDPDHPRVHFRGEDAVTSSLMGLIEGEQRRFFLITGKGSRTEASEATVLTALQDLGKQQNFGVIPLNLSEVRGIPPVAHGIIIIGAKYDFSDREMTMLRDYWSQKRASMLVLLEPSADMPRFSAFLAAQGVQPRNDRVLFAENTSSGPRKEFSVQARFSSDSVITSALRDATSSLSGQTLSLGLAESGAMLEQGLIVSPLMTASPRFWGESSYLDDLPTIGENDVRPPVHVAVAVERGAAQDERLRVDSARMIVLGNASLFDSATRLPVNQDFMAAALNWSLSRERYIGIPSKLKPMYRVQLNDRQRDLSFWLTTFCGPALVMMMGILLWASRRTA